ncbi:hypothetical protein HYC85_026350 [Camellia sinensis]|uniref:Uncharacterized protein n=1 Tax=Camellia sinensis TaxID=4442 RepID=A0A7J7G5I5_CAMSI|nr:hypothetical protein HYC85_026350 [Camellia sinensis]
MELKDDSKIDTTTNSTEPSPEDNRTGSSIGLVKSMQPAISNPASADSVISSKTYPNLCFAMQAHSSISFFGLGVESSAADHKDWCFSNGSRGKAASIVSSAVMHYMEKKKTRK